MMGHEEEMMSKFFIISFTFLGENNYVFGVR